MFWVGCKLGDDDGRGDEWRGWCGERVALLGWRGEGSRIGGKVVDGGCRGMRCVNGEAIKAHR